MWHMHDMKNIDISVLFSLFCNLCTDLGKCRRNVRTRIFLDYVLPFYRMDGITQVLLEVLLQHVLQYCDVQIL